MELTIKFELIKLTRQNWENLKILEDLEMVISTQKTIETSTVDG